MNDDRLALRPQSRGVAVVGDDEGTMSEYLSICTERNVPEAERRRGYPASHAFDVKAGRTICGVHIEWFFINGGNPEVSCKRCLKRMGSDTPSNS